MPIMLSTMPGIPASMTRALMSAATSSGVRTNWRAVTAARVVAQHRGDDLQGLVELLEAFGEGAEVEAELLVFELKPAGAEGEDTAPAADDIESRGGLGEQGRVAITVAGHRVESWMRSVEAASAPSVV